MKNPLRLLLLAILALGGGLLLVRSNPPVVEYPPQPTEVEIKARLGSDLSKLRRLIGSPVPDLAFRLIADDSPRRLSEYRGRLVLLNVWGTGCGPCLAEMPALNALQRIHGDRLAVITLTTEFRDHVRRFADRRSLELPPLSAYTYTAKQFQWVPRIVFPLTIFIDRDGIAREFTVGRRSEEELDATVRRYL